MVNRRRKDNCCIGMGQCDLFRERWIFNTAAMGNGGTCCGALVSMLYVSIMTVLFIFGLYLLIADPHIMSNETTNFFRNGRLTSMYFNETVYDELEGVNATVVSTYTDSYDNLNSTNHSLPLSDNINVRVGLENGGYFSKGFMSVVPRECTLEERDRHWT